MDIEKLAIMLCECGIDPEKMVGEQTALQIVEAAILGAFEKIEEG